MKILMILNDPPYGTERVYNGLRLATNLLAEHEDVDVSVFLLGDAASAAKSGQQLYRAPGRPDRTGGRELVAT